GQWGVLYGPNGAGKTTLIKILATLVRPSEGTVRVGGLEATKEPEAIRRHIGLLGHQTHLYEDLTSGENLAFTAALYGVGHRSERIERVLKQVGLADLRDATVRILSHGMKKRLALARVMLIEPNLLLLDEPYAGLDARSRELLTSHLVFFKEGGGTILLSTHFPLALATAPVDRLFVLGRGRIEQDEVLTEREDWAGALEGIAPGGWSS
ncbi:MAG: heme ABC exporter ATP-binding protein CcmA, partial [Candidatus Tectimicrobiota bacterium]